MNIVDDLTHRVLTSVDAVGRHGTRPTVSQLNRFADGPDHEWLSWPEAAELIGCSVGVIEHARRRGRIEARPFAGSRPTLRRSSVEAFARDHAQQSADRTRARDAAARRTAEAADRETPPEPAGWVTTAQAAESLGVTRRYVERLVRAGTLDGVRKGRRVWVREASVAAVALEREEWISARTAAELVGVHYMTIYRAAWAGEIAQRPGATAVASLSRASLEAWAERRRTALERPVAAGQEPRRQGPPDAEHEWERVAGAARRLGVSETRVRQLSAADRLPFTEHDGVRWFRADLIDGVQSARSARASRDGA